MRKRPFRKVVHSTMHTRVDRDTEGGIILKKVMPDKQILKYEEKEESTQMFPSIKRVQSNGKPPMSSGGNFMTYQKLGKIRDESR